MKTLPVIMKQNIQGNDQVKDTLEKLIHGKVQTKRAVKLNENLVALSKPRVRHLAVEETVALTDASGGVINRVVYEYNRFISNGKLYETEQYERSAKRKNCYVNASHEGRTLYFKLKGLVTLKQCNCIIDHHDQCNCCTYNVLICRPVKIISNRLFRCTLLNITSDFLSEVSECPVLVVALQLHDIVTKCIKVEHNNKMYLIDMPNMVEAE